MINRLNLILAVIILSVTSFSQSIPRPKKPTEKPNKIATPVSIEYLSSLNYEAAANDPLKARIYTLKNGLKVYLSVYKNAPRIQTFIAV